MTPKRINELALKPDETGTRQIPHSSLKEKNLDVFRLTNN